MLSKSELLEFLSENDIAYEQVEHEPVLTVEEASKIKTGLKGIGTKNLFLRDKKGETFFLVVLEESKRVHMKVLAKALRVERLSFGLPEKIKENLGVEPGSVTILSVVNDPEDRVKLFIDEEVWKADFITCHPLVNTATIQISSKGLRNFFEILEKPYKVISIPKAKLTN